MDTDRDLVITRDIAAPRDKLYRCWTEPGLIKQWFAPKPWTVTRTDIDLRVGADLEAHEKMGFAEGWGICTSRLAELAATL